MTDNQQRKVSLVQAKDVARRIEDDSFRACVKAGTLILVFTGENGRDVFSCPLDELHRFLREARERVPDEVEEETSE